MEFFSIDNICVGVNVHREKERREGEVEGGKRRRTKERGGGGKRREIDRRLRHQLTNPIRPFTQLCTVLGSLETS